MGPKDLYLVAYNSICCAGWALIWFVAVKSVLTSSAGLVASLSSVYAETATLLWYTQLAALLEIVHAVLKLVRSPVVVTAMQVGSRITALVAIAYAPSAQGWYFVVYKERKRKSLVGGGD